MEAWAEYAAIRQGIEIKIVSYGAVAVVDRWIATIPMGVHQKVRLLLSRGPSLTLVGEPADERSLDRFANDVAAVFREAINCGVDLSSDDRPFVEPAACPVCGGDDLLSMLCDYGTPDNGDRPTVFEHKDGKTCTGAPQRLQKENLPPEYRDVPPGTARLKLPLTHGR